MDIRKGIALSAAIADKLQVPPGSKVVSISEGGAVAADNHNEPGLLVKVGVFRASEEFVDEAAKLEHPFGLSSAIAVEIKHAAFSMLTKGPRFVKAHRRMQLLRYTKLAAKLDGDEKDLHGAMDPEARKLLDDKRVLLFKQMCKDAGLPDDLTGFLLDG